MSDQPASPESSPVGNDDIDLPIDQARPSTRKIVVRALIMVVGIGVAGAMLWFAFDDLDLQSVIDAVRSLTDAEKISLISTTGIVVWSEALLLATFVPGSARPPRGDGVAGAHRGGIGGPRTVRPPDDLPDVHIVGAIRSRCGDLGCRRQLAQHRAQARPAGDRRRHPGHRRHRGRRV